MGSYFPPKSDIDILVVAADRLTPESAEEISVKIAEYSDLRPTVGDIELSVITAETAKNIPPKIPYELHYSECWHDRIINHQDEYGTDQYDTDLFAHIMCVKKRGITLFGQPIHEVFGSIRWSDFMRAVLDDLDWILEKDHIFESPYYGILNICRALHLLIIKEEECLSKYEGAQWGLRHLPLEFSLLIKQAVDVYSCNAPVCIQDRKTGGVSWEKKALVAFRDYAKRERDGQP